MSKLKTWRHGLALRMIGIPWSVRARTTLVHKDGSIRTVRLGFIAIQGVIGCILLSFLPQIFALVS